MDDVQRKEALLLAVGVLTGGAADFAIAMPKEALRAAARHLAQLALDIAACADASGFDTSDLRAAAKALLQAEAGSRSDAISDLVRECLRLDGIVAMRDAAAADDLRRGVLDVALAGGTLLRLRVLPARGLDFLLAAAEGGAGGEVPEADADARAAQAELAREREAELRRKREAELKREAHEPTTAATTWWRRLACRFSSARATGSWWRLASWFPKETSGVNEDDPEAPLIARRQPDPSPGPGPSPSPSPSDCSPPWGNWLTIQTFSLGGSLCLLPYMGPAALLSDAAHYDNDYRWWVQLAFQIWWCLVIVGVPCALCCRSRIERIYARISAHLGMLGMYIFLSSSCLTATNEDCLFGSNGFVTVKTGITVNALFFCHWMLAAVATKLMKIFLGGAVAYFLFYWIRCCWVGEI
ncbi:uncharacterized protein LOC125514533 [Triticum urartu]|uniref:Uncharacterized protein n=1 Tax=Triticum urartu TaxID=4572 RepID=A0A8R7QUR2_TRIUA|nr:uncharacterized protein LOC125514533 [Triticum urartu]